MASNRQPARVALVTGASRGLGAEIAFALAVRGIHVAAVARTPGALEALDDRIRKAGGSATLVPLDLQDSAGIQRLAEEIRNRFRRLDILVHAAGTSLPFTPVRDIDPAAFERLWRTDADAARALIASFQPLLADSQGQARFICDPDAGGAYRGAYASSKEALRALVTAWMAEYPPIGIAIHDPPPMATALRKRGHPGESAAGLANPRDVALSIVRGLLGKDPAPCRHFPGSRRAER